MNKATQQHTPGPWKVNQINGHLHIGGRAYGIPNVIEIATVTALKERSAANAQLLAAAPKLLAACQLAEKHHLPTPVLIALRNAIAEATPTNY